MKTISNNKAFTLIEVSVVLAIIAILATISFSQYNGAVERSKGSQARVSLELIYSAERAYLLSTGTYVSCNNTANCNTVLNLELSSANWVYSVNVPLPLPNPNNFTATATRSDGSFNGTTITYNQAQAWGGTWPPRWW